MFRSIIKPFLVAFCGLIASQFSYAVPVGTPLPFLCDDRSGSVFVSVNADRKPKFNAKWQEESVNWQELLEVGPDKNQWGDLFRSGTRVASLKCGALTLRFSVGFLNANPQGQMGAAEFPLIEILQGKKVILRQTALDQCEVHVPHYQDFGACQVSWAESIEVTPKSNGVQVRVLRVFSDAKFMDVERTDTYFRKTK